MQHGGMIRGCLPATGGIDILEGPAGGVELRNPQASSATRVDQRLSPRTPRARRLVRLHPLGKPLQPQLALLDETPHVLGDLRLALGGNAHVLNVVCEHRVLPRQLLVREVGLRVRQVLVVVQPLQRELPEDRRQPRVHAATCLHVLDLVAAEVLVHVLRLSALDVAPQKAVAIVQDARVGPPQRLRHDARHNTRRVGLGITQVACGHRTALLNLQDKHRHLFQPGQDKLKGHEGRRGVVDDALVDAGSVLQLREAVLDRGDTVRPALLDVALDEVADVRLHGERADVACRVEDVLELRALDAHDPQQLDGKMRHGLVVRVVQHFVQAACGQQLVLQLLLVLCGGKHQLLAPRDARVPSLQRQLAQHLHLHAGNGTGLLRLQPLLEVACVGRLLAARRSLRLDENVNPRCQEVGQVREVGVLVLQERKRRVGKGEAHAAGEHSFVACLAVVGKVIEKTDVPTAPDVAPRLDDLRSPVVQRLLQDEAELPRRQELVQRVAGDGLLLRVAVRAHAREVAARRPHALGVGAGDEPPVEVEVQQLVAALEQVARQHRLRHAAPRRVVVLARRRAERPLHGRRTLRACGGREVEAGTRRVLCGAELAEGGDDLLVSAPARVEVVVVAVEVRERRRVDARRRVALRDGGVPVLGALLGVAVAGGHHGELHGAEVVLRAAQVLADDLEAELAVARLPALAAQQARRHLRPLQLRQRLLHKARVAGGVRRQDALAGLVEVDGGGVEEALAVAPRAPHALDGVRQTQKLAHEGVGEVAVVGGGAVHDTAQLHEADVADHLRPVRYGQVLQRLQDLQRLDGTLDDHEKAAAGQQLDHLQDVRLRLLDVHVALVRQEVVQVGEALVVDHVLQHLFAHGRRARHHVRLRVPDVLQLRCDGRDQQRQEVVEALQRGDEDAEQLLPPHVLPEGAVERRVPQPLRNAHKVLEQRRVSGVAHLRELLLRTLHDVLRRARRQGVRDDLLVGAGGGAKGVALRAGGLRALDVAADEGQKHDRHLDLAVRLQQPGEVQLPHLVVGDLAPQLAAVAGVEERDVEYVCRPQARQHRDARAVHGQEAWRAAHDLRDQVGGAALQHAACPLLLNHVEDVDAGGGELAAAPRVRLADKRLQVDDGQHVAVRVLHVDGGCADQLRVLLVVLRDQQRHPLRHAAAARLLHLRHLAQLLQRHRRRQRADVHGVLYEVHHHLHRARAEVAVAAAVQTRVQLPRPSLVRDGRREDHAAAVLQKHAEDFVVGDALLGTLVDGVQRHGLGAVAAGEDLALVLAQGCLALGAQPPHGDVALAVEGVEVVARAIHLQVFDAAEAQEGRKALARLVHQAGEHRHVARRDAHVREADAVGHPPLLLLVLQLVHAAVVGAAEDAGRRVAVARLERRDARDDGLPRRHLEVVELLVRQALVVRVADVDGHQLDARVRRDHQDVVHVGLEHARLRPHNLHSRDDGGRLVHDRVAARLVVPEVQQLVDDGGAAHQLREHLDRPRRLALRLQLLHERGRAERLLAQEQGCVEGSPRHGRVFRRVPLCALAGRERVCDLLTQP
eukprot:Rhum_TRINITY_DN18900_c0_g1::Rhum_TRINITY_DN18900_c0_g1_i1::g.168800::m.168800